VAAPEAPLPPDWRSLARTPTPFAALYRLSCCGQRNLILAVRGGADRLSINVAVPPGGAAMSAWFAGDEGWIQRVKERCREPLPPGSIPLPKGAALPIDPGIAGHILSGLLPEGAREESDTPGWVEASDDRFVWRARIEGSPARCTRVVIFRRGEEQPLLVADLKTPLGHVPSELLITAGAQQAELVLQERHPADPPQPPAWLGLPGCGASR
jgi:hypothetical protein